MANDNLDFGIRLGINMEALQKEWEDKEKDIQKMIDDSAFKIRLDGVEGLDKIRDQLKEIQKLQKDFSKPLTGAQALREQLKHEERARLANAKAMEFEAGSADRLRRQKAQAELAELRLARAKERSVKVTNAQTQAYRTQTGVLNGLKQFMNSYISLLGGYRLMSNIKQITSEFELQRVSLRAITQDAQFADALFAKIKTTATQSPYATKELVTYTKQLAAYRIENEELYGTMNMLADVSAGLGVSMDRLILAYGQVKAASVLRGTELRQFTEAGIPLVDELAKKFSQLRGEVVSTGEVFDLISTRQVPFEMVADIFREMTAEGGRFYEMQKKQSESLYGVFENLKDNIQNAYDEIGQSNRGLLMGIGKLATAVAKNLSGITAMLTPLVAGWGAYAVSMRLVGNQSSRLATTNALLIKAERSLNATMNATNATRARASILIRQAAVAHDRYAFALARAATANNVFTRSLYKMQAALIANPVTAIFTAIATVVAGGITLWNRYLNSLESTDRAHKRSAEYIEAIEKPMKNMDAQYDRLIKKIKEYDILIQTQGKSLSELKKIYPELFNQYSTDAERQEAVNTAMKERVTLINELKTLAPEQLSNISAETATVEQLALAWQNVTEEQRKAQLQSLEAKRSELEELIRTTRARKMDVTSAGTEEGIIAGIMTNKVNESAISGYQKELDAILKQIDSLKKATEDAAAAQLLWRKEYNKFMKGDTLKDHELAALNFANTIKETRDAWKDATDRAKEYQDAINAAKTQKQTAEVRKNVEEYKKQLATQQQIIKNAESYAKFAGFSLQTGGKVDTTPLDNLKAELSLVEKIYKRYGELRRLMSDEAAKADIEEIYGNLTDVDFLDPAKLKARLQKMLKAAQDMGDSGKQLAIELGLKIQDIDLNDAKDKLESALSSLSQQIKQQKDASEFFKRMLGLTGDVELSTNLTLGVTGVELQSGNVGQLLSRQLSEILVSNEPTKAAIATEIDLTGDWNASDLEEAISNGEISVQKLQSLADTLPKEVQPKFKEALASFVEFNKQQVESLFKTIDKFGDFDTQINLLGQQMQSEMDAVTKLKAPVGVDQTEWDAYIADAVAAIQRKYNQEFAKLEFTDFQERFAKELENLDAVAVDVVNQMLAELQGMLTSGQFDATNLKSLMGLIEKLRDIKFDKQPIAEFKDAWKNLIDAIKKGDKVAKAAAMDNLEKSLRVIQQRSQKVESAINGVIDAATGVAESLGIAFSPETEESIKAFQTGFSTMTSVLSAMVAVVAILEAEMAPLLAIGLALGAAFAAINWFSNKKVRAANKEIERQERLLKNLERAYDRLEETQEQLVGTDWVKNQQQQIANLQRQISAFEAQRAAEQSKGKKRDDDAIEDYTDKILDAQKQIRELQRGVTEEMVGTGLPDAAKDFAQSWLDAYLSFDDTMGALKASFKDMMKTMVQNSMMAKLVQKRLEPVFAAIDRAYEDAELTPAEWQSIMDMGNKAIEFIDEDLNHLAEMLGLRSQLGEQDASNLTGIAKGVAQASEETVLTLAGYANSILYYQVWIKDDVAAIRAILEGKAAAVAPSTSSDGGFNVGQLVTLQQQSLSQLQAINLNTGRSADSLSRLEDKIDSIISTAGTSSRKVVNTRLSN